MPLSSLVDKNNLIRNDLFSASIVFISILSFFVVSFPQAKDNKDDEDDQEEKTSKGSCQNWSKDAWTALDTSISLYLIVDCTRGTDSSRSAGSAIAWASITCISCGIESVELKT